VYGEELAVDLGRELFHLTSARRGAVLILSEIRRSESLHVPSSHRGQPPQEFLAESIIKIEKAAGKFKALSVLASTFSE
jgi:hypothetical protein